MAKKAGMATKTLQALEQDENPVKQYHLNAIRYVVLKEQIQEFGELDAKRR